MTRGDRVLTPFGPGRIVYIRMAPPDFAQPEAVSVRLDSKVGTGVGYVGTIVKAEDVRLTD